MNQEDLIDKIIRGEKLSEVEAKTWAKIKDDPSVKEELSLLTQMDVPLKITNRKILKNQLKEIESSTSQEKGEVSTKQVLHPTEALTPDTKIRRLPKWLYAAAGFLLLAAASFLMRPQNQVDYFANHYEVYPSIVNPILKGTDNSTENSQAYIAYQNKDYQKALTLFELVTPINDTTRFYKAISLIETNKYQQAISILDDLQTRNNRFQQEASWYEALCQLKADNREAAVSKLNEIKSIQNHPFASEAAELLTQLE